MDHAPWLSRLKQELIEPRRERMLRHPFLLAAHRGEASPEGLLRFFSGLLWHLKDFDKHVAHLVEKRGPQVSAVLKDRPEDQDGNIPMLRKLVEHFGGNPDEILTQSWAYRPHPIWVAHDSHLRACIYSTDLPWQAGTSGLNIGIETLVPSMIGDLLKACLGKYGMSRHQAEWLESRSGEEEIAHGENGYILLSEFVRQDDQHLQAICTFYADALSYSMSERLLQTGL